MNEAVLLRMKDRLTGYIQRYVQLAGADKREEVLDLFDKMQLLFPSWVIMTCPVMHPDIRYLGSNYQQVFGNYTHAELNGGVEKFFELVHDADQENLHRCFDYVHGQFESVPPDLHYQYRQIFHYRFRKFNGQNIYVHDEKAVLHLEGSGNLYYVLMKDITAEKAFAGVKVELFRQVDQLSRIGEYKPSAVNNALSKREGELVTLIRQGLSTKEIAWYLKISHHTVRNIKSRMFEKFNVSNTVELLNMTA